MIYIKHQMFDVDSINVKHMEYIITFDKFEYKEEFLMNTEELKAVSYTHLVMQKAARARQMEMP